MRPISWFSKVSSLCFSALMYLQSKAKSSEESVSLFSPSQSVSLLMKWASYLLFAQASRRLRHTEREERRIWLVSAYLSSEGKVFDSSNISIDSMNAFL